MHGTPAAFTWLCWAKFGCWVWIAPLCMAACLAYRQKAVLSPPAKHSGTESDALPPYWLNGCQWPFAIDAMGAALSRVIPKVPSPFLIGDFNAALKELRNVFGYLVQRFGVVAHALSVTVATPDPQAINVTFNEGMAVRLPY